MAPVGIFIFRIVFFEILVCGVVAMKITVMSMCGVVAMKCRCVCVCVWGCSYEISVCACVCGVVAMKCRCVCVRGCSYEDDAPVQMRSRHIRPRARHKLNIADISIGSRVLVNYNYTEPETRGYWYDAVVTGKHVKRSVKQLTATVFIGYTCPTCLSLSQYCLYVLFLPVFSVVCALGAV